MGTWNSGSFDNDSAADYIQEVIQDGLFALSEAFEVVLDPDTEYVDAEEGARAVAAAEILAAIVTEETGRITDAGLREWISQQRASEVSELPELAVRALDRVLSDDSELPDLWADGGQGEPWQDNVRRVLGALA